MLKKIIIDPKNDVHYYKSGDFHTQFGVIKEKEIKNGMIKSNLGKEFVVFDANFLDELTKIRRGPAITHPKDIGLIIVTTGIGQGSKVLDAGSGSGSLSSYLARIGCKVTSYEINKEFFKIAQLNHKELGLEVEIKDKDVHKGIDEKDLDLIILDLPDPWNALKYIHKALKNGAFLVCYLPTVTQVAELVKKFDNKFYMWKVSELLEREWHVEDLKVRPKNQMLGHTAFVVFARKI
ncbi:MAG TPA: methyltransferase domain-containing protein [Candidatus Nanoarchaeia archaeon]|nr:methyltransferase domain-containing protein [Candidatus Nanoarchaeia archaeon]